MDAVRFLVMGPRRVGGCCGLPWATDEVLADKAAGAAEVDRWYEVEEERGATDEDGDEEAVAAAALLVGKASELCWRCCCCLARAAPADLVVMAERVRGPERGDGVICRCCEEVTFTSVIFCFPVSFPLATLFCSATTASGGGARRSRKEERNPAAGSQADFA